MILVPGDRWVRSNSHPQTLWCLPLNYGVKRQRLSLHQRHKLIVWEKCLVLLAEDMLWFRSTWSLKGFSLQIKCCSLMASPPPSSKHWGCSWKQWSWAGGRIYGSILQHSHSDTHQRWRSWLEKSWAFAGRLLLSLSTCQGCSHFVSACKFTLRRAADRNTPPCQECHTRPHGAGGVHLSSVNNLISDSLNLDSLHRWERSSTLCAVTRLWKKR